MTPKKLKPVSIKVKTKKATKSKANDKNSSSSSDDSDSERETKQIDRKPALKKLQKSIGRKVAVVKSADVKEVVVRKRMASLNASAMMAATYEVERQLDKCEEKMYKIHPDADEQISAPKKAKEIKNEVFEPKEVCIIKLFYAMVAIILSPTTDLFTLQQINTFSNICFLINFFLV